MAKIPPADATKAVSHPLRAAVLDAFNDGARSPRSVADELGESLKNVSYHVAVLRDLGAIELVDTRPRRGALEHFYRAKWRVRVEVEPIE